MLMKITLNIISMQLQLIVVSNKLDFKLEGMDKLVKDIEQLGRKGGSIENKALKEAAIPILKDAKSLAPVLTGKGRAGLDIGNIRRSKGIKYINIGVEKGNNSDIFYMKFHEYGTSKMAAKPFLGPAYEKNKNLSKTIIINILKEGLGLK